MSRLERIIAACGGILLDGGTRALIPGPNHGHKDRSVSLRLTEEGRILIHCFSPKDDWRDVRRALTDLGLLDDEPRGEKRDAHLSPSLVVAQPLDEERVARAGRLWEESSPLKHSVAEAYLRRRAVPAGLWGSVALRFNGRMTSLDDRAKRPALVAAISDAHGALQGVQVTLLSAHGTAKAAVATPRRVIGKLMGGAVRLADAQDELAIGEGIETMLTASDAFGVPAWAALSADNLSRLIIAQPLRRLIIAADNDEAGMRAAQTLRARMASSTRVEIEPAPPSFNDWNDWARAQTLRS
ncbi:MAG: toprim domain-containing protein [Hyphomonadaceae bacterium]|nr:toprim domain-containing protein [Hyphomonadaceae bacterium]